MCREDEDATTDRGGQLETGNYIDHYRIPTI